MPQNNTLIWDIWYPQAGATGLPFARGSMDATDILLVHAAPPVLTVTVQDNGTIVARGENLEATDSTPIVRLTRQDAKIERKDIWPGEAEIGRLVLLPGGEVGTLLKWWNADDHSEWRWQIELYNHK
ncbi:MAG: hypothetical protein HC822_15415 [Oscillochloris sp.]|nr:hypothetical protein [Oscillochloris sp.]